jgi:hypothetical protein
MKKFILLFLFTISATAQIKGVVKDGVTKQPIAYVSIWVENKNIGTTSEENGSFELNISENENLIFSVLGYETKTISVKNISEILLIPKINEIEEVIITSSLNTKQLEIGDVKKVFYLPEPQDIPWLFAKKFNLDENNLEIKYIKELIYFTYSVVENGIFRARVFEVNENGLPGDDLISEEIIVNVKKGKHKTIVDISKYNIQIPEKGIVVCFESLIVDQNRYLQIGRSIKSKKKNMSFNYSPHIGYFHHNNIETYNQKSGKWVSFSKEYNKEKKHPIPAINVTLSN